MKIIEKFNVLPLDVGPNNNNLDGLLADRSVFIVILRFNI